MKELLMSSRIMLFKHIQSGEIIKTRNLFYGAFPKIYEFMGYEL